MNLTAVCASRAEIDWPVEEIPFVVNTKAFANFPRDLSRERIQYNSDRRNEAHRMALAKYPDTTHFLSIDSYYCDQPFAIRRLVAEYESRTSEYILGSSNWYHDTSMWPARRRYWDTWTTPEMKEADYSKTGVVKVKGAGGVVIYPVEVWTERPYAVPENFPESGCEMNHLCQHDPFVYLTFNVKFWHPTPRHLLEKPFTHRVRTRLALRSRLHA